MKLEIFSCAGGMAEGFRRAGITFDMVVDYSGDACESYERNLGQRPIQMNARDLLRMVELGWSPGPVDLIVADPPCTPWSRAGNRLGMDDDRDMLAVTCSLIRLLSPRCWLIGNVPGLDDSTNAPAIERTIGTLSARWCVADVRLDAADFGVPQHRVRPFWFGHPKGEPSIQWPTPTHGAPLTCGNRLLDLDGVRHVEPWVTVRQALAHLSVEDLGRPVRLRFRGAHSANQSKAGTKARASDPDAPAGVVTANEQGDGNVLMAGAWSDRPIKPETPSKVVTASGGRSGQLRVLTYDQHHPPSQADEPAMTVRAGSGAGATRAVDGLLTNERHRLTGPDEPSAAVTAGRANRGAQGGRAIEWPWDRPSTTVTADPTGRIPPPGHMQWGEEEGGSVLSMPGAVVLSERAAALLQGFPDGWHFTGRTKAARWSQIGQAMPPALAEAVARAIVARDEKAERRQSPVAIGAKARTQP